ncbi:6-O-methylguanine DNA methyltransferase, DNA binding domain [Nonomuraea coxensis DSM 45129]|uniref:6-O-methylguanine DNA methyltransferase, DNA binding domain n=1 Tax=Nonomuraea coxensis DSM 45129 TaxID=1122611 RepID=A0ABX8TR51_9ACTN|nr:MGMT family protein [Nonomuraea coxensis]QYC37706.1 6-O-methylguanine DNA methyltransferase, DNA binding domain [Nonomuraea coxensis DSM 45129]
MSFTEHIAPIFRAALEILRDAGRPMQPAEVREAVAGRVSIDPGQEVLNAHGQVRWHAQLGFRTGEAASLGWMTKRNGWAITPAGVQAVEDFPGIELYRELVRQYRARRQSAQTRTYADPRWKVVLEALARLAPGSWTTYGDIAEVVGMSAQSVGGFMAEAGEAAGAHRVLQSGGKISPGFRWLDPERTDDPREVLEQEGVTFDQYGRAASSQRVTAGKLRAMLSDAGVLRASEPEQEPGWGIPAPFEQFQQNLGYARQLLDGGRNLERLGVGAFDVTDLYRAAWTQSVAALDHWITREIIERGVALALQPGAPRPAKFDKLTLPVALFEKIHHHDAPLAEVFRTHLEQEFEYKTFQNPEKIQEGFAHVSSVKLWVKVAEILTEQDPTSPVTSDGVRARMRDIARRRNNIAHTADHDPDNPGQKLAITAQAAEATIDWLESIAIAIQLALGDPLPTADYDAAPAEAGGLGAVPMSAGERRTTTSRARRKWDEESLLQTIEQYCSNDVARTLLEVYRHAERHPAFRGYYYGEGAYPSATARFSVGTDEVAVWSIYTGASESVLSINFEWMRNRGVAPEVLSELAETLSGLPGWAGVPGQLVAANYAKRPSLTPIALARPAAADIITSSIGALLAAGGEEA